MHKIYTTLLLLSTLFFSACAKPVGQTCTYQTELGFFKVVSVNDIHKTTTLEGMGYKHTFPYFPKVKIGDTFATKLKLIKSGSCTPIIYDIMVHETLLIKGTSINFSDEGKLEKDAEKKILLVTKNFLKIQESFKEIKLIVQTSANKRHSDDYRYALAMSYANKAVNILIKNGLKREDILIVNKPDRDKNEITFTL